jgi:HD-GYP domain-containing protein (c-di-GMP phosphodiesterase class II)
MLGLAREQLAEVRLVALLHQAGMAAIPSALRAKTEPLTPVEWAVVQRHTLVGRRMIENIPSLSAAVEGVSAMRERWDGTGYPRGLAGEAIPLSARVVAPCVAYRAMRAGSPRRSPVSHDAAIAELRRAGGRQFDPVAAGAVCLTVGPDGVRSPLRLRAARI